MSARGGAFVAALVAVLLLAARAAPAQAQPRPAPSDQEFADQRVTFGFAAARTLGDLARSSAQGPSSQGFSTAFGVVLRYDFRLRAWLSLAATGGYSWSDSTAATDAGYSYRRFDLGLAPSFRPIRLPPLGRVRDDLYLSIPIGASHPTVGTPPRRAFDETVDGSWGWYAGCVAGIALMYEELGAFLEAGYLRHATSVRSTITPDDPSSSPVIERTDYRDNELVFVIGVSMGF